VHTVILQAVGKKGADRVGAPFVLWCTERSKPCNQAVVVSKQAEMLKDKGKAQDPYPNIPVRH
jgi:hypothetical protein